MATEEKTAEIIKLVGQLLEGEPDYFVVSVSIRPVNNISLFIDGDSGITIEKCVKVNKALYKQIVETTLYPDGEFSLEVSSPGLDEPLKLNRQYIKNIGRSLMVELSDGQKVEGKLIAADNEGIELEEELGKGKKKEVVKHAFLFNQIKESKVNVVF
jgi:ribosome maturation factor RimP